MQSADDQPREHSTWEFGKKSVDQGMAMLPAAKLTMGLPMYARSVRTGEWTTYEDIIKYKAPEPGVRGLAPSAGV